jgi:pimeloyl-ACP methyl ester carboxylesterase
VAGWAGYTRSVRRISAGSGAPDTIVLIHGLWLTPRSWEGWAERYRAAGFRVLTPAWPGVEGDINGVRADGSRIGRVTMRQVVDHHERIVRELDKPPMLMGHSFGGSVVQILLGRGQGAVGIAINSAPVKGVRRLPLSTLRAAFPVLRNPANRYRAVPLNRDQFHYAIANTMAREQSDEVYERHHVPAASHVLFEGALASLNPRSGFRVDFSRIDRAPLLFIAGGADHVNPPSVIRTNAGRYQKSPAVTAYHEFPGRSHFTVGEDGWEEVADYALEWALEAVPLRQPQPR